MPNNKNFLRRIKVIDRELQGGTPKSVQEIMAAYNKGLLDDEKVTSKTTFLADIHEMENKLGARIPTTGRGKNIRYYYEDPNFSIFDVPLKDHEIIQLSATLQMLSSSTAANARCERTPTARVLSLLTSSSTTSSASFFSVMARTSLSSRPRHYVPPSVTCSTKLPRFIPKIPNNK